MLKKTPLPSFSMYRVLFIGFMSAVVSVLIFGLARADTAATRVYQADSSLAAGTVVSLKKGEKSVVEEATIDSKNRLFGVVVRETDSSLRLRSADQGVFVTTDGPARTFVTDINGAIEPGDQLTISPIKGVAMRSSKEEPTLGVAVESFNEASEIVDSKTVTNKDNQKVDANLGIIGAEISVKLGNESVIPSFLASLGETLAGKPVSSFRLFLALVVMLVTLTTNGILLFGAIRSAIVSIGRNPLSKNSVYKGLFQILLIVAVIFIAGSVGAYIILRG